MARGTVCEASYMYAQLTHTKPGWSATLQFGGDLYQYFISLQKITPTGLGCLPEVTETEELFK